MRERRKANEIPIEFTVAIPEEYLQDTPKDPDPVKKEEEVKEEVIPDPPPPKPKEPVKEPVKEKPPKEPIKKSTKVIQKTPPKDKPKEIIKLPKDVKPVKITGPKLTPEEIAKLLDLGAKVSDHTSVPGENERCLLAIKESLYAAWIRPSAENKTGRSAVIEITLGSSGAVLRHRLVKSSGSKALDDSALAAAAATPFFRNLTPGFLRDYSTVTIEFELQ